MHHIVSSSTITQINANSPVDHKLTTSLEDSDLIRSLQSKIVELQSKLEMNKAKNDLALEAAIQRIEEEKQKQILAAEEELHNKVETMMSNYVMKIQMEVADALFEAEEQVVSLKRREKEYLIKTTELTAKLVGEHKKHSQTVAKLDEKLLMEQMKYSRKVKILERDNDDLRRQVHSLQSQVRIFQQNIMVGFP